MLLMRSSTVRPGAGESLPAGLTDRSHIAPRTVKGVSVRTMVGTAFERMQ